MTTNEPSALDAFKTDLQKPDLIARLQAGLIGEGAVIDGPFGPKTLIYADYVASGRALRQIETFVMDNVLPYYANSHTEASWCGSYMTRLRERARSEIARCCGATDAFATVFTGSGATAGLNRLVHLLGVSDAVRRQAMPLVILGPYEHHSNILPWRESGADVVEIGEAPAGGPDLAELEHVLNMAGDQRLIVGAFSLMSNVTGIVTDADAVTRLLKKYGALSVWDCAGSGPYLPIDMKAGTDAEKDAVVVSAHKFPGGPGASGVMIVRKDAVAKNIPVFPGGGTVRFVSPWAHDYSQNIASREEAGTPNVVGDIRAALVFLVKEAIGQACLDARHQELRAKALSVWKNNPAIEFMGKPNAHAPLPMVSFRVKDLENGGYIHQQLVTRMLSDVYGIQARGGCACAGPYAHRLLEIGEADSSAIRQSILDGEELQKPGWTRLNLSALMTGEKADFVIGAVDELTRNPYPVCLSYSCDETTARFKVSKEAA
ncbi:selenocysteine lyase/cysteine desulfurase [Roseibium hamelinense]|uniref:Selenocysteine lyase/cysteine desulfurase n=1 Tax=Roseibium hamelinense TaxID=150831 RepID=A0A562TG68_9HYPH|nr:aminotransferase class V-fold PLP-dependent enzyme [Roseibium hamelinense]MTI43094.1 aminotransferase class V-fold PLP-dependent enzyme [Roseibium hamelinense]TWI92559.1 selenocysteine lyase/cysteine desulfurase [Roseibium hamelinense]